MIRSGIFTVLFLLACAAGLRAQMMLDKVVAVVGNEYILYSDLEAQMLQIRDKIPQEKLAEYKCFVLDQLMQRKLMLARAKVDSLKITEEQVQSELDRRVQLMIEQYQSTERLEKFYGKSILEIKNDFHDMVKDQLLTDQMQSKILSNVDVTPAEVKKYFQGINEDSLPYYNTEMEVAQIVIYPKIPKDEKQLEYDKLQKIRQRIMDGTSKFDFEAIMYSEDPGSATHGGDLGWQRADNFVPEFAAAALSLKKDSISPIIETKYGYHIIKLLERKGEMIHVVHILRIPKITPTATASTEHLLDSIRSVVNDSFSFEKAAYKYSEDQETRNRGGYLVDPRNNSSSIPVDQLDAAIFFTIDKLKVGEVSKPVFFKTQEGKDAFRLLYLKAKTLPHKANLKDDYPKIKEMALEYQKNQKMENWFKKRIPKTFVKVDPEYQDCPNMEKWKYAMNSALGSK